MRTALKIIFLFPALTILISSTGFSQEVSGKETQALGEYSLYTSMVVKSLNIEFKDCQWCEASLKNLARDLIACVRVSRLPRGCSDNLWMTLMLSKRFEEVIPEIERLRRRDKGHLSSDPLMGSQGCQGSQRVSSFQKRDPEGHECISGGCTAP